MNSSIKTDDSQLVRDYLNGSEEAIATLIEKHKGKVYTIIYVIVKDKYVAEDLLQDAFIKALDKIRAGKYNEEGKFGPWILRIAHNLAIDKFRKAKRNPTIIMDDGANVFNTMEFTEESIESVQIMEETHSKLRSLIDTLPENQREVLTMRHYADMSFQEIAEATGVSINTALGRMRYALINLRKKFQQIDDAYDKYLYSTLEQSYTNTVQ